MEIKSAVFECSSSDYRQCPATMMPEYAFIGRSNVGKSSLINMLVGRKALAKTSGTPGKTLLINHFRVNDSWYIVDLPGYGYAQVSKKLRAQLKTLIETYVLRRPQLTCLMMLIDSRHPPMEVDMDFLRLLGRNGIPFAIIFTKLDKLSARQWAERKEAYLAALGEEWEDLPPVFATSAAKGTGRDEVLSFIENINAGWKEP